MLRHDRPQFFGIDTSALGVVVQLLIVDCPDREVAGLRMGEHKSAGRLSGRHHVGFGQCGADCLRYVEQFEQLGFQRVVRTGRIAKCGPDTPVPSGKEVGEGVFVLLFVSP